MHQQPRSTIRERATNRGFTLVELMVTLGVLALLLALGVPALSSIGERLQLASTIEDFVAQVRFARSEAIKRRTRVVLCKSADGTSCATAGGWEQGWIVFQDIDNNGRRDAGEPLLRRGAALPAGWRFSGNQSVSRYISYAPSGGSRLISGAFQAGTLTLCRRSDGQAQAKRLIISAVGRPRVQHAQLSHCA